MKKYIIPVGSSEISRKVQKALFEVGFTWSGGMGKSANRTDAEFLTLGFRDHDSMLITADDGGKMHERFIREGATLLSSQEVIKNPFQLDGAKQPVKEMTVAEIQEALGHDVKVIDG